MQINSEIVREKSVGESRVAPFIGGELASSSSDTDFNVINPSNGRSLFSIPVGSDEDVSRAVTASRCAFRDGRWSEAPPSFRKASLHRLADLIAKEAHILDALDAEEMGKPFSEAFFNAASAAGLASFYAEALDKVSGDVYSSDQKSFVAQRRVPRGVVAAIVPWNFPTFNAVLKLAPALAAGNCVVLKPSEMASRSALRLASLAVQAGIPPDVLNVVPGVGPTVGRALALHMEVDMLAFTGSTEVGKQMLQYAGQSNMKVVVAECGGKSPQIVFADGVDLDAAGDSIARLLVTNQGQICSVGSRLLVQRSIHDALVDRITARMRAVVMGDALDPKTTFGPLVSSRQCKRVMKFIDEAQADGARLVHGGGRALLNTGGYFVEPALLCDVLPGHRVAREEVFGPVLSVISFDDVNEAIHIANDTMYGLVAYVWAANLTTAMRMSKGVYSSVIVYSAAPTGEGAGHMASFEPVRQSGLGVEGGFAGMESYLRRQTVCFYHT